MAHKWTGLDGDLLSRFEGFAGDFEVEVFAQGFSDRFDVALRDHRGFSAEAHELHDGGMVQHLEILPVGDPHKDIAAEERQIHPFHPVGPFAAGADNGTIRLKAIIPEVLFDPLFMASAAVEGVPEIFVGDFEHDLILITGLQCTVYGLR